MRYIGFLAATGLILAVTATAGAITGPIPIEVGGEHQFTISNADLITMGKLHAADPAWHPDGNLTQPPWYDPGINDAHFVFELTPSTGWPGFSDFQVGWAMAGGPGTLPGEYGNLSSYDSYLLSFHNLGTEPVMVNLFMNTGWTDIGQPDNYYQNTWTWVEPCHNVILDLDLAGVQNLDHVSALGFNIGTNNPGGVIIPGHLSVDTVPEPLTMAGLALGIGSLATYLRRRKA